MRRLKWQDACPVKRLQSPMREWPERDTIQALGWQSGGRYLPLEDGISSVAFWHQTEPFQRFPVLPGKEAMDAK